MNIRSIVNNQIARESGILFISESINIVLAGLVSIILRPNFLNPHDIGLISYATSLVTTLALFFNFGLDNSGCRLILKEADPAEKRRIAGMTLFIALVLCAVFSLFLFIVSFFIPYFGNAEAAQLVRLILPFSAYSILKYFIINICYALGEMYVVAFITISLNALYLPLIIVLYHIDAFTMNVAIFSEYSLQMMLLIFPMIFISGKQIRIYRDLWKPLRKENRDVGLKVFLGRIIFLPTFDLDKLILGAFHSIENVGFYTIAKMLAGPTIVLGQSISQSLYRRYNDKNGVSKKISIISLLCIAFMSVLVLICGYIVVSQFMNQKYLPVLSVFPLAVIAAAINGYIAMFTTFMDAKGMAVEVRNVAIVGMALSLILNFSLIIPFGMAGGMVSRIIVLSTILAMRMHYCRRYSRRAEITGLSFFLRGGQ